MTSRWCTDSLLLSFVARPPPCPVARRCPQPMHLLHARLPTGGDEGYEQYERRLRAACARYKCARESRSGWGGAGQGVGDWVDHQKSEGCLLLSSAPCSTSTCLAVLQLLIPSKQARGVHWRLNGCHSRPAVCAPGHRGACVDSSSGPGHLVHSVGVPSQRAAAEHAWTTQGARVAD